MLEHNDFFLTSAEIAQLTGRKNRRLQIEQLSLMRIPFHVNALGAPIVVRGNLLTGSNSDPKGQKQWKPSLRLPP